MGIQNTLDEDKLADGLAHLRGDPASPTDGTITIPVNALEDLHTVLELVETLTHYRGNHRFEILLVVNNYSPESPPGEIEAYRRLGMQIVAVPSARRPGEVITTSARALGIRAAKSDLTINFDADCEIEDVTALLDWYVDAFRSGARLAYTSVGFHHVPKKVSVKVKLVIHFAARWVKRNLLGIPTARGSNYAISRSLFIEAYDGGKIRDDLQVGATAKLAGARIAYSGKPRLRVYTSARRFRGGWKNLIRYMRYRALYNLKAIPTSRRREARTEFFDRSSEVRETARKHG